MIGRDRDFRGVGRDFFLLHHLSNIRCYRFDLHYTHFLVSLYIMTSICVRVINIMINIINFLNSWRFKKTKKKHVAIFFCLVFLFNVVESLQR